MGLLDNGRILDGITQCPRCRTPNVRLMRPMPPTGFATLCAACWADIDTIRALQG